jgi:Tol biopolymer transport system component
MSLKQSPFFFALCAMAVCFLLQPAIAQPEPLPYFTEPAISPDRTEVAFISSGDIWTAPINGGEARLLVSHPSTEARPLYSPDGKRLAFISERTGNGDIYLLTFVTGELKRLTFSDANDRLDAWSRDGKWIYFTSGAYDIRSNDIWRISVDGGTPMQFSHDRFVGEFFSQPSPDGASIAFTARGNSAAQWWRKGHSHLDEAEIWTLKDGAYQQHTNRGAKEMWPLWSGDGRSLFYVSDRSGAQNLWAKPLNGAAKQITQFKDGRVLWPNISYDGKVIVFERNFGIWKFDTANNQASEIKITKRGAAPMPNVEHLTLNQFQELALSPDGKKIAVVARGEIFAASAKDGGDAVRVTRAYARDGQITWSPDSKRIAYISERNGNGQLFLYDFTTNTETQLTSDKLNDAAPKFSPDGKSLAFVRDRKELRVFDVATKQDRVVATGYLEDSQRTLVWAPDSKWIAYGALSTKAFRNVFAVPVSGGEARAVSSLPNGFISTISWSPDGTYLLFNSSQRTEDALLARVDLTLRTPKFREDQFRDLFKDEPARPTAQPERPRDNAAPSDAKKDEKKPVEIVFENIRQRASSLATGVNVISQTISPDGKTLLLTAVAAERLNLFTWSLDELSREPAVARQITSTPTGKSNAQFTPDSKEVYFLENGRISIAPLDGRPPRALSVNAALDIDFAQEKLAVFQQAWTYLRDEFYDDKFHGVNWDAVRTEYAPRIAGATTPDEMRRLLNLMVGELNASHMGVAGGGGGGAPQNPVGRIGLRFERAEYENNGRLKITELIALSPAANSKQINVGDFLLAVDSTTINARTNLDELLTNKIGRRVELQVAANADGSNARTVALQPVSANTEGGLLYRQWVEANRAYVEKISQGKLGYVHMPDMGEGSLRQLYLDLDADNRAKEGVVIDVRNNNGGFVNVYAIDVLARRGYLQMTQRGLPTAPARSILGQRSLELPTILVTNQHSLSDAEDFTEGYRTLKLGKVVGEPTSGWIIYTWSFPLLDGSTIRMPRMKITTNDGVNMELNPRPVDIPVTRPIGESLTGKDSQLDTAVRELLKQLATKQAAR